MAQYEVAVIYHPDLEVDLTKSEEKVVKIITENGGKVTETDNWGKRKLAYPVKGQDFGVYVFYAVEMEGVGVNKINDTLNITDEVIRFLITKPDLKKKAKSEELKAKKAAKFADSEGQVEDEDEEADSEEQSLTSQQDKRTLISTN